MAANYTHGGILGWSPLCHFGNIREKTTWVGGGGGVTGLLHRVVADGGRNDWFWPDSEEPVSIENVRSLGQSGSTRGAVIKTRMTDAVEKGICRLFRAVLNQDVRQTRNIDPRMHALLFDCCPPAGARGLFRQHRPTADIDGTQQSACSQAGG
jgi:hypothetical protein